MNYNDLPTLLFDHWMGVYNDEKSKLGVSEVVVSIEIILIGNSEDPKLIMRTHPYFHPINIYQKNSISSKLYNRQFNKKFNLSNDILREITSYIDNPSSLVFLFPRSSITRYTKKVFDFPIPSDLRLDYLTFDKGDLSNYNPRCKTLRVNKSRIHDFNHIENDYYEKILMSHAWLFVSEQLTRLKKLCCGSVIVGVENEEENLFPNLTSLMLTEYSDEEIKPFKNCKINNLYLRNKDYKSFDTVNEILKNYDIDTAFILHDVVDYKQYLPYWNNLKRLELRSCVCQEVKEPINNTIEELKIIDPQYLHRDIFDDTPDIVTVPSKKLYIELSPYFYFDEPTFFGASVCIHVKNHHENIVVKTNVDIKIKLVGKCKNITFQNANKITVNMSNFKYEKIFVNKLNKIVFDF